MIALIMIGWAVGLPMLVVGGLYATPRLMRNRAHESAPIDVPALAREFAGVADLTSARSERSADVWSSSRRSSAGSY